MQPMEIGRRMAQLGQKEDAQKAYTVALTKEALSPMERFEAASYIFFFPGQLQNGLHCPGRSVQRRPFPAGHHAPAGPGFLPAQRRGTAAALRSQLRRPGRLPLLFPRGFPGFSTNCPCGFSPLTTKVFCPMTRRKTALAPMSISTTRSSTGIFSKIWKNPSWHRMFILNTNWNI